MNYLKLFENFTDVVLNERFDINSKFKNLIMLNVITEDKSNIKLLLYDTLNKEPIGYISSVFHESIGSYTVGGSFSENGYGPFLYESVMSLVYPNGLSMSRCGSTSFDALEVWEKFDGRSDVRKERINSIEITHKKEDLTGSGMFDDDPEQLERIFELEDTRFFYTYGVEKLNKILKIGNIYQEKNGITNKDIEYMTWDLE